MKTRLGSLRNIPTLVYRGSLFPGYMGGLHPDIYNKPNIYLNDDVSGDSHEMRGIDIPPGNMGDDIIVPWINRVLK